MAHTFRLQHLVVALLAFSSCTIAVGIPDIYTVQTGNGPGSCDAHAAVLDEWLEECIFSTSAALDAIDAYDQSESVRDAMNAFFHVQMTSKDVWTIIKPIRKYIEDVFDFYSMRNNSRGPVNDKTKYWLHCDSTFLSEHQTTDAAWDLNGKEMHNSKNELILIRDVEKYKVHLSGKNKPWWPTNITDLNGYYFDEDGGHFCSATNLGVTANIRRIERRPDGSTRTPAGDRIASVIICPSAFSNPRAPNNYRDASNNIVLPGKSLGDLLPKSATLLHETFHALFGKGMLAGPAEKYDIADVINLSALKSRRNIENYVFFIAHMYLLLGEANPTNPQDPVSVPKNWDFKVTGTRGKKTYGAVNIIP